MMKVGMLWLDDSRQRSFDEKITRAADYYQEKYGKWPDLCLVNTTTLSEAKNIGKIEVQPTKMILKHHFWLGVRQK